MYSYSNANAHHDAMAPPKCKCLNALRMSLNDIANRSNEKRTTIYKTNLSRHRVTSQV